MKTLAIITALISAFNCIHAFLNSNLSAGFGWLAATCGYIVIANFYHERDRLRRQISFLC